MHIEMIKLNNFRSFADEHVVDFRAHNKDPEKTVILFGGLNGSGKTSILTAIRLAILGKKSFEGSISNKDYKSELRSLTHQPKDQDFLDNAFVEVAFNYVKHGEEVHYRVRRSWINSKSVEELVIYENDFALSELSNEQAQSFLIELIPVGIADLFFFDGEKIKELAEEIDDQVLAEALKKMIGVDFIERAVSDLSVLLREKNKASVNKEVQIDITKLEQAYEALIQQKKSEQQSMDDIYPELVEEKKKLSVLKLTLEQEGGEWASSRDDFIKYHAELQSKKNILVAKSIEAFKGRLPFEFAPMFMKRLMREAITSIENSESQSFNRKLEEKKDELLGCSDKALKTEEEWNTIFNALKEPFVESKLVYVSPITFGKIKAMKAESGRLDIKKWLMAIEDIESDLDNVGKNIARAPDHATLKEYYQKIHEKELAVKRLNDLFESHKQACKSSLQEAISITYKLEKLMDLQNTSKKDESVVQLASTLIGGMRLLISRLTALKVGEIENLFHQGFKRIMRKEDMNLYAKIEPESFNVKLVTENGTLVDKKRLSSGEKQIYALAMIEALGKASGRKLPLIIDTPLSRLDSKHREKITMEFFPKVNDQVIILSTDTEVDEKFYAGLQPYIAKSYELRYNEKTGESTIHDGYFWKEPG